MLKCHDSSFDSAILNFTSLQIAQLKSDECIATHLQLGKLLEVLGRAEVRARGQPLPNLDEGRAKSGEDGPQLHRPGSPLRRGRVPTPLVQHNLRREGPQLGQHLRRPQRHLISITQQQSVSTSSQNTIRANEQRSIIISKSIGVRARALKGREP